MKLLLRFVKILLSIIVLLVVAISIFWGYRDIPLEDLKAKYAQSPSKFISVNGMEAHYRDEGNPNDSIPIVLIHGTGASLHTFDGWTEGLKEQYRVIRMDLPGYGLTGPFPDRDYSIDNYVSFIKAFLDELDVEQCVIGGNSLGGRIAWGFTSAHSEMVEKQILIDAAGYPSEAKSIPIAFKAARMPIFNKLATFITPKFLARKSVTNVYADKSKVTDELANRYFELTLREGNRQAFVDRLVAKYDTTAYQQIKDIQQSTLILWGDQDFLIPVENAYKFQDDLANDTLVVLENLGHVPMEEDPMKSLIPVLAFLADN